MTILAALLLVGALVCALLATFGHNRPNINMLGLAFALFMVEQLVVVLGPVLSK